MARNAVEACALSIVRELLAVGAVENSRDWLIAPGAAALLDESSLGAAAASPGCTSNANGLGG